jgi:hypothetical protein
VSFCTALSFYSAALPAQFPSDEGLRTRLAKLKVKIVLLAQKT